MGSVEPSPLACSLPLMHKTKESFTMLKIKCPCETSQSLADGSGLPSPLGKRICRQTPCVGMGDVVGDVSSRTTVSAPLLGGTKPSLLLSASAMFITAEDKSSWGRQSSWGTLGRTAEEKRKVVPCLRRTFELRQEAGTRASIRVTLLGMMKPMCWLAPGCPRLFSAHGHVQASSIF